MAGTDLPSSEQAEILLTGEEPLCFEAVRDHQSRQFQDPEFDEATGLPVDALRDAKETSGVRSRLHLLSPLKVTAQWLRNVASSRRLDLSNRGV